MSPLSPTPQKTSAPRQSAPGATSQTPSPQKGLGALGAVLLVGGLLALAVLLYVFGITPRLAAKADLDHEQKISTQRVVIYEPVRLAAPKTELPLPGTIEAFQQASIYARTSGYVKRWMVDIGQVVHEGDILAELDTPEVDEQLRQAQATVEQAKASLDIAQSAADRWNTMIKAHAVSQEEAAEKNATRDEAKGTLDADLANVARLTDLQNFKQIRAPFTGTITYRNIEVGNLVSAGTGSNTTATGTSGTSRTTELYRIAQTDPLRVYVDVPENSSRSIEPGVQADLHIQNYPDRIFHGEVVRSAGALDNTSRTLKTEIRVANPDGALLPGAYADVRLQLADSTPTVLIPANALIVNSSGTQVALLETIDDPGADRFKVHILPVKVGRDFGTEVEVLQDLKEGDRLVANPPAEINDGAIVTAKPLAKPSPTPTPSNQAPKA